MTKHTPGPWRIATSGNCGNTIEAQSGRTQYEFDTGYRAVAAFQSCESSGLYKNEEENRIANGNLIAAAPELLEACIAMRDAVGFKDQIEAQNMIEAAIAKATGENHD
jgi:hypothetical protein